MNSRSGISLVEVLIAIFVTAVGMLSLLTLFPAGMQSMAQAVQDTRVGHAKENATAIAHALGIHNDPAVVQAFTNPNPDPANPTLPDISGQSGRSYPVLVDPFGYAALSPTSPPGQQGDQRNWVAGDAIGIPRRPISALFQGSAQAQRRQVIEFTTFLDDIQFGEDDTAGEPPIPGSVERAAKYSWGYLLQQPRVGSTIVDFHVIVYKGRSQDLSGGQQFANEVTYQASYLAGRPLIGVQWNPANQQKPDIRQGTWLLDSTTTATQRYGQFYRAVSVSEGGTDPNTGLSSLIVEVQNPIFQYSGSPAQRSGKIVVLYDVVDVFDKGTLSN